jgi:thiazole/oxazole-forming peptide maturase SagD family component
MVDPGAFPAVERFLADTVGPGPPELALLALDSPLDIPCVAAVGYDDSDAFPAFVVSAAADFDPGRAMRDAVVEVLQGWFFLWRLRLLRWEGSVDPDRVVVDFEDNALYYALPDGFEEASFLLDSPTEVTAFPESPSPSNPRETLSAVLDRFEAAGVTPVGFDLTTPDVREVGLVVARVVAPELVDLSPPAALPAAHPAFEGESVTTKPHPFP